MRTTDEPAVPDVPMPESWTSTRRSGPFVVRDLEEFELIVQRLHEDHLHAA